MTTVEVGKKLVEMCNAGKFKEATQELYAENVVSVEASAPPGKSARMEGLKAVLGKADWWEKNHEVHSATAEGPFPHGDRFIVRFKIDITPKNGPMAGKRIKMDEAGLYTVKEGKVVEEEFFYDMGG